MEIWKDWRIEKKLRSDLGVVVSGLRFNTLHRKKLRIKFETFFKKHLRLRIKTMSVTRLERFVFSVKFRTITDKMMVLEQRRYRVSWKFGLIMMFWNQSRAGSVQQKKPVDVYINAKKWLWFDKNCSLVEVSLVAVRSKRPDLKKLFSRRTKVTFIPESGSRDVLSTATI